VVLLTVFGMMFMLAVYELCLRGLRGISGMGSGCDLIRICMGSSAGGLWNLATEAEVCTESVVGFPSGIELSIKSWVLKAERSSLIRYSSISEAF